MAEFVRGRELARAFYEEVVGPLVAGTPHSAALVGTGSDVLGFDTERSTDHGWGPRMHVFVRADDVGRVRDLVDAGLPEEFRGWPVRYGWTARPVSAHVVVTTLDEWLPAHLGFDPRRGVAGGRDDRALSPPPVPRPGLRTVRRRLPGAGHRPVAARTPAGGRS